VAAAAAAAADRRAAGRALTIPSREFTGFVGIIGKSTGSHVREVITAAAEPLRAQIRARTPLVHWSSSTITNCRSRLRYTNFFQSTVTSERIAGVRMTFMYVSPVSRSFSPVRQRSRSRNCCQEWLSCQLGFRFPGGLDGLCTPIDRGLQNHALPLDVILMLPVSRLGEFAGGR
jgi:hypothetical protein